MNESNMPDCSIKDSDLNNLIDGFRRLFNRGFGLPEPIANGGANYYILLIKYFPTTFNEIVKKANDLSPGIHKADLINGKKQLLKAGVIGEILPTLDQENQAFRKKFRRETIFPVSPNALWDVYSNQMKEKINLNLYNGGLDQLYNECYLEKFDFKKIKDRIRECHMIDNNNSGDCLTMYFSSMWVIYNLLENAGELKTLSLMLSGKRAFVAGQTNIYEKLASQGIKTKAILDERYQDPNLDKLLQCPLTEVKYNQTYKQGTRRIVVADNLFALDGRKLLPFDRPDPPYIGTMYFDQNSINMMRNIFMDAWG
jgi:hypothetical protein